MTITLCACSPTKNQQYIATIVQVFRGRGGKVGFYPKYIKYQIFQQEINISMKEVDFSGKCGDFPVLCRNAGKHLEVQIICSYSKPILQARFGGNLGIPHISTKRHFFTIKCTFHQKVLISLKMHILVENTLSTYSPTRNSKIVQQQCRFSEGGAEKSAFTQKYLKYQIIL